MSAFKIVPEILQYSKVSEFLTEFTIKDDDFLFLSRHVYDAFFSEAWAGKKIFFRSDYGKGEPNSDMVNALIKDYQDSGCDRIIAIGGGSVMDMAKVLVVAKEADCESLFLDPPALEHQHSLVLIPTTCGSGSEVSNISIVELLSHQTKYGLAKDALYADQAVLIPELLHTISDFYFKTSAIDGLVHAIESFLSSRSNTYTRVFQIKAIELYLEGFKKMVKGCSIDTLYSDFATASNMAGISFANTGTGCVHAISYPLSGTYHVTHGLANSIFLVEVLKMYERNDDRTELTELKKILSMILDCSMEESIQALDELLHALLDIRPLKELGMREEEIQLFADSVIQHQQRLMSNGYITMNNEQVQSIYQALYE